MAYATLKTDGDVYEALHRFLTPHDIAVLAPDRKFPDYDHILKTRKILKCGKRVLICIKYEVKGDKMTCYSGNIPIEFHSYSGPSGISNTKSNYWIHFVHNYSRIPGVRIYYQIPMEKLRKMIDDEEYHTTTYGGNNNYSGMYLFNEELFSEYKKTYHTDDVPEELLAKIYDIKPTYPNHAISVRTLLRRTTGETHI